MTALLSAAQNTAPPACLPNLSVSAWHRLLACLDVAFRLSLAAFVAFLVLRFQPLPDGQHFFCTTIVSSTNMGVAALLLPLTAATAAWTLLRCYESVLLYKKRWWVPRGTHERFWAEVG